MMKCECGAPIDPDKIYYFKQNGARCPNCGYIYEIKCYTQYVCDDIGDHGEIAHRYMALGNRCPRCGKDMFQHRLWHDLTHGESIEALETIMTESGIV